MSESTVFISAASVDLEEWREVLHGAFARAGFRVYTQKKSLSAATKDVRNLLEYHIEDSDCIIHLAGMGYGAEAGSLFPEDPDFRCSWSQYEYYYAHKLGKDVIAFVCAPQLSKKGFVEKGNPLEIADKRKRQQEHRGRVLSPSIPIELNRAIHKRRVRSLTRLWRRPSSKVAPTSIRWMAYSLLYALPSGPRSIAC